MPDELGWIVQRCAADLTSRSLQKVDATSASLRKADPTSQSPPSGISWLVRLGIIMRKISGFREIANIGEMSNVRDF